MTIEPPLYFDNTGNRTKDTETGVRQIIAFTEDRIRENPGQWFWVHRRWPKTLYKKSPKG